MAKKSSPLPPQSKASKPITTTVTRSICFPASMWQAIKAAADAEDRSVSNWVNRATRKALGLK